MSPVMRQVTLQDVCFRRDEVARKADVIPFHLREPTFLTGGNRNPKELGITQTRALRYIKATQAVGKEGSPVTGPMLTRVFQEV
jgi:hypothetical protein